MISVFSVFITRRLPRAYLPWHLSFVQEFVNSSNVNIADPIDCIVADALPKKFNIYCWLHAGFSDQRLANRHDETVKIHVPENMQIPYHSYFHWIYFIIFFQALSLHLPHSLWTWLECGHSKWHTIYL